MNPPKADSYLQAEVLTASPEKRQLMLIEEAIRSARRADELLAEQRADAAQEEIDRARYIILNMLAALDAPTAPQLVGKVASVYLFIVQALGAAMREKSSERLHEALDVLHEERITWQAMCDAQKTPEQSDGPHPGVPAPKTAQAKSRAGRFSMEA